jgi:hypothetical protein
MQISTSTRSRSTRAKVLAQFRVAEESERGLVLQQRRLFSLLAAAFTGTFGALVTGAATHFYPPRGRDDLGTLLLGGGFGVTLLALAAMFLYFGLRRPDRIVVDASKNEVRFERRRNPLRLPFDQLKEVAVRTENRSRRRELCIVHPVVLVTPDGRELQVDAASDVEAMIALAARLRRATGLALPERQPA